MSSLSIRGLDNELSEQLKKAALAEQKSVATNLRRGIRQESNSFSYFSKQQ